MKKTASKVAQPAQIQPKSQFLFHKNLPPRDFSLMTLTSGEDNEFIVVHNGVLTNDREAKKLLENKGEILKILVRNNQEFSSMENILEKKSLKL